MDDNIGTRYYVDIYLGLDYELSRTRGGDYLRLKTDSGLALYVSVDDARRLVDALERELL